MFINIKMMRNWIGLVLILFLGSCSNPDVFSIEGKFENSPSKRVFLASIMNREVVPIDSMVLGTDGSFKFKIKPKDKQFYLIVSDGIQAALLGEKGTTVFLKADLRDSSGNFTLYGDDENKKMLSLNLLRIQGSKSMEKLVESIKFAKTAQDTQAIYLKGEEIQKKFRENLINNISSKENQNNFASFYALNFLDPDRDFVAYQVLSEGAGKKFKGNSTADSISEIVKEGLSTSIGQRIPEIKLPDPNGLIHSIYELKGKYVLVDFWASWCGPCRRENPDNVKLFNTYKDKGFTVFGVSLDREKEAWKKGIEEDKLPWTQVSDLKYWDSEVVSTFHFNSIPHNILIDPSGIIIAKNLHGEDLANFLMKKLGKSKP